MRRIPIQLDDETYRALKRRAFEENRSIASLIRESLAQSTARGPKMTIEDFPFVGSGRSKQGSAAPISEHHDQALGDIYRRRGRK